ncbi:MAG: hypothetical protein ACD_15C00016G0011 [uncultured bacterium]|nr:MAG: hypothetical protein ACD_15C00016G0011 [uncultured bacterium]HCU70162.1 TIGR02391 family protein [Candidatus Moranbacteria bacterium]
MKDENYNRVLEFQEDLVRVVENFNAIEEIEYSFTRDFLIEKYPNNVPTFLKECRTLKNFTNRLLSVASGSGSWQERRNFIYNEFKDFLNFLEFGEISKYDEANINDDNISIILRKEVFSHVKDLLNNEHYFNAVEESYKIVREKLRDITGKEKAHEAFAEINYNKIFGHDIKNEAEKDFFEGVKFLHMAIQKLRNEKAHTPANKIDKNLAIHYIVLASLAYDLIDRH